MRELDWKSACLYPVADPDWQAKIRKGGWVLLLPFIGWPAVLGYRKDAVFRLIQGQTPVLPDWNQGILYYTKQGLKAVAVINAYYLPVYIGLAWLIVSRGAVGEFPWLAFCLFILTLPIFSTLMIPIVVTYARFGLATPILSTGESIAVGLTFSLLTFLIPSGFLNVSQTGRILSALDIPRCLSRIVHLWRRYLEAWFASLLLAAVGHGCLLFLPWGIVWSYLGIVFLFNEVPATTPANQRPDYLRHAWFDCFRQGYWNQFRTIPRPPLWQAYQINNDVQDVGRLKPHAFWSISCGPVEVPIRTVEQQSAEESPPDIPS